MNSGFGQGWEILATLVAKEFKVRYKNTALGFLWSLAHPVFFAFVFYVAFRHILKVDVENYLVFLLAGLFPWQWFAGALAAAPTLYVANAPLIKKVRFPRILLPMSLAGNHAIHFLLALLVAVPVLAMNGVYPSWGWIPGIPILLLVQAAVILGVSLIVAAANAFLRDLQHMTTIFVSLIFYLTPILYQEGLIPSRYHAVFRLNPLYYIIPPWRSLMLEGRLDWGLLSIGAPYALAILLLGLWTHARLEWRLAEVV